MFGFVLLTHAHARPGFSSPLQHHHTTTITTTSYFSLFLKTLIHSSPFTLSLFLSLPLRVLKRIRNQSGGNGIEECVESNSFFSSWRVLDIPTRHHQLGRRRSMENVCDVNHLDADVLLPPRKRLLAGLKKQSSDGDAAAAVAAAAAASPSLDVVASCVRISEAASSSSSSSSFSSEFEARLKNLLSSHSNNPNLTPEEVVEASKVSAVTATRAARVARAAAEEKAEIAAKAVAAAKNALDLVASFSEEALSKERNLKKNKLKKHLPVQLLYKKYQPIENCRTDEELARKLHRAMNSSPRISKNSPNLDSRGSKHKKPKSSSSLEITEVSDFGQDCLSLNNGHAVVGKIDSEGSIHEVCSSKEDKKGFRYDRSSQMEIDNDEAESSQSKEKNSEDLSPIGKKRGRVKLKKLPLSICSSKERAHPKEGVGARSCPLTEMNTGNHPVGNGNIPLFPVEPSTDRVMPIEATTSMCKCQEFKAPACIKQNKAVQS